MDKDKIKTIITDIEKDYDFADFVYNFMNDDDLEQLEDLEDLRNYLEEINEDRHLTDIEIVYYTRAIDYLSSNDASLNESMGLAIELGYDIESINSELLASLYKSNKNLEDYSNFIDEVINKYKVTE